MNTKINVVTTPGAAAGSVTRRNALNRPHPSMRAASSISSGTAARHADSIHTENASE